MRQKKEARVTFHCHGIKYSNEEEKKEKKKSVVARKISIYLIFRIRINYLLFAMIKNNSLYLTQFFKV